MQEWWYHDRASPETEAHAPVKEDGRRNRRYKVRGIHGKVLYSSDFTILNISIDGAAVETSHLLMIDREYAIKLTYNEGTLNLKGKVMWSTLSHSRTNEQGEVVPVYRAGLRFRNIFSDESLNLLKFIESQRLNAFEKRLFGVRFKVSQPNDAVINVPCEYAILKLSLSGMLIETNMPSDVDSLHDMELNFHDRVITVRGRIANYIEIREEESVRYQIGIEFVRIDDEDLAFLKTFLESVKD
ncbi:MAG: hypothetical protein OHK006_00970 [Thermodesulfovibrionales bacterium]